MEVFFKDPRKKQGQRPVACACYICGREYGTHSLQIHIKTCKKKWEIEQSKLPKRKRRPLPKPPEELDRQLDALKTGQLSAKEHADLMEKHNAVAYAKWDQEALVSCKNCGRTFLPDRLVIHKRSCKSDRPLKARFGTTVANCLIGNKKPEPVQDVATRTTRQNRIPNLAKQDKSGLISPILKC